MNGIGKHLQSGLSKHLTRITIVAIALINYQPSYALGEQYQKVLELSNRIVGIESDDLVSPILEKYADFKLPLDDLSAQQNYLFNTLSLQKWGNSISEYIETAELLFSYQNPSYQSEYEIRFKSALIELNLLRQEINNLVHQYHPGLNLNAETLRASYQGDGMKIAVFDLFDERLLERQGQKYQAAYIESLHDFGDPPRLSHGNNVIDIILSIAPHATIIPVSTDTKHYNLAMHYLLVRDDIHIINMSRTFVESDHALDPEFKDILNDLLATKIVTKALGNTGTDLEGHLSPVRAKNDMPPVNNLFAYDLKLIKEFLDQGQLSALILFAINMNLLGQDAALTATIPGSHEIAQSWSLATIADGVYSWSTDNFESGSSFGAPQLAAISALLWQSIGGNYDHNEAQKIIEAMKKTALVNPNLNQTTIGLGFVNADEALSYLQSKATSLA